MSWEAAALSAIGGAATGAGSAAFGGGKSGKTYPAFHYYPDWLKEELQRRATEPLDSLKSSMVGQFKNQMGKEYPGLREKLGTNYALRGLDRSGFMAEALRKSYQDEAGGYQDFYAQLPIQLENIRASRLAAVTGAQGQMVTQPPASSIWGGAMQGFGQGLSNYSYMQGLQQALSYNPTSISPSYAPNHGWDQNNYYNYLTKPGPYK